jgi:hypothetical protein
MSEYSKTMLRKGVSKAEMRPAQTKASTGSVEEAILLGGLPSNLEHPAHGKCQKHGESEK